MILCLSFMKVVQMHGWFVTYYPTSSWMTENFHDVIWKSSEKGITLMDNCLEYPPPEYCNYEMG